MRLHHVAYETRDIERKADQLLCLLAIPRTAEPVVDPQRGVRILFLDLGATQLELLGPLGPDSPVARRAHKAPGLLHPCFEVNDLDETLRRLQAGGEVTLVKQPIPAPAVGHRRVAFVVSAGNDLIEFVERELKAPERVPE